MDHTPNFKRYSLFTSCPLQYPLGFHFNHMYETIEHVSTVTAMKNMAVIANFGVGIALRAADARRGGDMMDMIMMAKAICCAILRDKANL